MRTQTKNYKSNKQIKQMKKLGIALIAAAGLFASCAGNAPTATFKSGVDTLSYAAGVANTRGLRPYLEQQMGIDSTQMKDFIRGLKTGVKASEDEKQKAYYAGIQVGQQVKTMIDRFNYELSGNDSVRVVNDDNFLAAFIAAAMEDNKGMMMDMDSAMNYLQNNMERIKSDYLAETYAEYKAANEKFLAENKTKEGVKTTPSGLQYKVLVEGKGEVPAADSRVKVNYKGTLIDGTEFDSSYNRNTPATFGVSQVIKGWTEALKMMPVGSKWQIFVPQELAYGSRETGKIKPFSTLVFEVELLEIVKDDKK